MSVRVLHVWMAVHALMVLINIPAAVHLDTMEITVKIVSYMGMIWVSGADVIQADPWDFVNNMFIQNTWKWMKI